MSDARHARRSLHHRRPRSRRPRNTKPVHGSSSSRDGGGSGDDDERKARGAPALSPASLPRGIQCGKWADRSPGSRRVDCPFPARERQWVLRESTCFDDDANCDAPNASDSGGAAPDFHRLPYIWPAHLTSVVTEAYRKRPTVATVGGPRGSGFAPFGVRAVRASRGSAVRVVRLSAPFGCPRCSAVSGVRLLALFGCFCVVRLFAP
jgi:hypothetical protein